MDGWAHGRKKGWKNGRSDGEVDQRRTGLVVYTMRKVTEHKEGGREMKEQDDGKDTEE